MAYQVLYRTYRPSRFSEVVGQEYIVKTLVNAIRNNKIAHAYLFAGPRGTGKTSIAKLFAKAINCSHFNGEACDECPNCKAYLEGNHPDIIELDAASNNGVDDIREIIEQVPYAPLIGKYKVYIIDEVHMLTTQAFNALLKTLEEPPAHVIFILATTDPQKVIPTVLSRCQRYNFSKISLYEIKKRMMEILDKEKIPYEEKAAEELSRMAEGGMRDALSLLEQCLSYNPDELKLEDVEHIFGLTSVAEEVELYLKIHDHQISEVISEVRNIYTAGADVKRLAANLLEIVKDVLIYSDQGKERLLTRITAAEAQNIINVVPNETLFEDIRDLEQLIAREKQSQNFLVYLELCLIRMAEDKGTTKETVTRVTKTIKEPEIKTVEEEVIETKPVKEDIQEEKSEPDPEMQVIETDMNYLLSLLLNANKDLKISDQIVYNKLDLYAYEPEKRKFYQMLIGTELFASNKDAIIISGSRSQADNINTLSANRDLYRFLNKEFGIDKMVYAIDQDKKRALIEMYKNTPIEARRNPAPVFVEKYNIEEKKEKTPEEKLKDLFGDTLKVEE
ncbi:MAG: DNA polymerase III subunit gamma/tau [Erysipelotrichaceae bacterium]|nr:DNA polymerase III subunit gamma/tau [Erysipelotrichaceae bacterium]